MFDTHIHRRAPDYPQSVYKTTHEHRAPTDESLRLLREMEHKARESVILALRTESNCFKLASHVYADQSKNVLILRVRFTLNEIEFDREIELPNSAESLNREAWLKLIRDEVAKAIAGHIVLRVTMDGISRNKLVAF